MTVSISTIKVTVLIVKQMFKMSQLFQLLLICLLAVKNSLCIHKGKEGKYYFNHPSVALIETGYGVKPQYGNGAILSKYHVLTTAVCCTMENRFLGL